MRYGEPGALIARLPADKPAWEPMLVTLLRRYLRRRAPFSLVVRLAGGAANFHILNECWDLDGTAFRSAIALLPAAEPIRVSTRGERRSAEETGVGDLGVPLSMGERRIALLQVIVDYAVAGETFPPSARLARYLGCTAETINSDLDWLRAEGRIACHLQSNGAGPSRVIRVSGTDLETAPPERWT